jgi:hypothetical protein
VSNIVKDLNRLGIPTGPMPDGSANLTVAFTFANTKEHFRALKFDASVQCGSVPGKTGVVVYGRNAGGSFVAHGMSTTSDEGYGAIN